MGIKRSLANVAAGSLIGAARLLGHQFFSYAVNRFMEDPALVRRMPTPHGKVAFWAPNEMTWWRAQTLLTKEPETIEWIDGFGDGDVYWDIGANIGAYTLYAGMRPNLRVLAFEPSPFNYYALCRNIALNGLSDRVAAYCLAINDVLTLNHLNMTNVEIGGALSSFGQTTGYWGQALNPVFRQAMIGFSVDDFATRLEPPFPNHIKIDVDGIEAKIIEGARHTLSDPRLKSLLIELDEKRADEINTVSAVLQSCGLKLAQRRHSEMIENSEFASSYNFIFVRES